MSPLASIGKALDLFDAAYLSRLLQKFEKDGLVQRDAIASGCAGEFLMQLSAKGSKQFAAANARQVARTTGMLGRRSRRRGARLRWR